MNALAARVTAVNGIAEQLLQANPPSRDRIVTTQQQLNQRWEVKGRGRRLRGGGGGTWCVCGVVTVRKGRK